MNITTRAILINSRSENEVSSIRKVHLHCLTYVEKISNVSRYEFTSIAVYKLVVKCKFILKGFFWFQKGVSVETTETLLDPPLAIGQLEL